ncbi:alkaline phosphatase family protein [Thiocapsa bogorovii]|uniref:alkaline phosphatase family protein n=1 Tax=Thiocapsa bogorovii TaxID=521689 RepID=UPI001E604C4D|nr:alkaline phosphatase family protein [Thiocapsa bogorovii]UHD15869.1 alkaline phosphatase family protein [Thiocapsa bogorovii]
MAEATASGAASRPRLLIIGLDGLEIRYAERLMDRGELPALAALRARSACFRLDHGPAQRTGLAWEHFASGLSPAGARRRSAVEFDPGNYKTWQEGARFKPFLEQIDARVTVFDAPYVDLRRTTEMRGVVGWGAHDPGTEPNGRPDKLSRSFQDRFGPYPAAEWTYTTPAYCAATCESMGRALAAAVERRLEAALWMLQSVPDTDVFFVVTGELHSAIEGLWHGVDPNHPLHTHPSAPAAAKALLEVHRAVDRFVARLAEACRGWDLLAFAMGGMGTNTSDLQSMALLPELLFREAFGRPLLQIPSDWTREPDTVLHLDPQDGWSNARNWFPAPGRSARLAQRLRRSVRRLLPPAARPANPLGPFRSPLNWQPTTRYAGWWSQMNAFALPSFYDGRIRINLRGREGEGRVDPDAYARILDCLETLLGECRDPLTDAPAVAYFERPSVEDPFALDSSDADLTVVWSSPAAALIHPRHGMIGPLPYRRTGGHTGPHGVAYLAASSIATGDYGERSSFDIAPTVADLVGARSDSRLSGRSLLCDVGGSV